MPKWLNGEFLFGGLLIAVIASGMLEMIGDRSMRSILRDSGTTFALAIMLICCALLLVVVVGGLIRDNAQARSLISHRGIIIALVGMSYPLIFWAAEYLIATIAVGTVALGLFTGSFGRKTVSIALGFAIGTYAIFFFFLGLVEPDGAIIRTGLNDLLPTWRRDFFASF